jgi:hypothetical protein
MGIGGEIWDGLDPVEQRGEVLERRALQIDSSLLLFNSMGAAGRF